MREKKKLVTHKKMKHDTLMQIIDAVRKGYNTKKSIQEKFHFSWGTCSESINYLENIHILESGNLENSGQPGPRSSSYSINRSRFLIMGIEVAVREIHCTISALDGGVLFSNSHTFDVELNNLNTHDVIRAAFFSTLEGSPFDEEQIYAVGFALTGALDGSRMLWIRSPLFKDIENLSFQTLYTAFPGVKHIYISHDVQCRAMDIVSTRNYQKSEFITLHVSEGVGMAAYEGGTCIVGHRGLAGEIGHIPYPGPSLISGTACFCGKKKCLETFLNYRSLLEYCNTRRKETIKDLNLIGKESSEFESLYSHLETLLLYTCVILVNIFDTSCLIISGKSIEPWVDRFKSDFPAKLKGSTWEGGPEEIIWINEASTSPSHGACLLHLERFYSFILQDRHPQW